MGSINDSLYVAGLSCGTFNPPAGCIGDAAILVGAGIDDAKLKHRYHEVLSQTGAVVGTTAYLRIVQNTGAVLSIEAAITETIATGADRTCTVDLQKSTGGAAFASVLSAAIVFNNLSALRTITTGVISTPGLVDGDLLRLVVTVAGVAGAQAAGLLVSVVVKEAA